jgi:hypothetical protein
MRFDIRRIYHKNIPGRLAYCDVRQRFPYSFVRQRQNRLCMLFLFPNSGGMSLHEAFVRVCDAAALINRR